MPRFIKSSFLWQFAGGFVLGAIGLFTLHPAEPTSALDTAPVYASRS